METENLDISLISTTTKSSSWPIIRGSFDDAITCESSFSAVDSDSDHDHLTRKPPLIMRRPAPDSDPCEITIFFSQQHEIRQIYVRSTARVYEIYYAADAKGDNQYLCTVRCGVAARIEELMPETDGVESLSTSSSSSNRSFCEGHFKSESGGSATEDGWVDVKVQNSCMLNAGDGCLEKKDEGCIERVNQDCYEATAEISDVDPVQSVTLRLLSIQSGDYIYVDEVYLFADPVLSTDANSSINAKETSSSESATMSLLIPTLLNLSKLRRNQMQEQSDSALGGREHQDTEHKSNGAVMVSNTSQSERIQGTVLNCPSMSQPELPVQRLDSHNNSYTRGERDEFSCSRIEKTLDELVTRVSKIEQFFVRFEENMVKPISNMEARLERVELQLESFVENAKSSMTACPRVSAPDFSSIEPESNFILAGSNDFPGNTNSKSIKMDETHFQDRSIPILDGNSPVSVTPNDVSPSTTNQITPGLVVTAPDFSYIDNEGEMDSFETAKDSPKSSLKKPISVDDALASALAGFLSSTSINTDMVEGNAKIIIKEENGITCPSELIQSERVVPSDDVNGDHISCKDIVVAEQETFGADDNCEVATDSVDDYSLLFTEGYSEKPLGSSDCDVANLDLGERKFSNLSADVSSRTTNDDLNQTFVFGSSDSFANDLSVAAYGVAAEDADSSPGEDTSKECPGLLLSILQLQKPAILDFGIPILDVKFSSQESISAKSSFHGLLLDVPEVQNAASCVEEDNATSFSEQNDLVMFENVDSTTSESPNSQFCFDDYDSSCMPSYSEEVLPEFSKSVIQDMDASLI